MRIVLNPARADTGNALVRLSDQPTLVLGASGKAEEQFSFISGLFRLSDGGIAVANAGSFEVRIFDSTGKFVRAFGRAGNGPGEFQSLFGIFRLPRDSIAAFDTQLQTMTVFAPDGTVGRTFTLTGSPVRSRVTPVGLLGAGTGDAGWLMISSQSIATIGAGPARLQLFLTRHDQSGTLRDTIATVPGFELFVYDRDKGGGRVTPTVLFGRGAAVAANDHGFIVAVNDSYEVRRYDDDGRIESIVRHAAPPRIVTAADIAAARSAQLLLFRSPEQKALLQEAFVRMPVPATMPAFGSMLPERFPWIVVNESGGFWVLNFQTPSDKSSVWSIFDKEGKLHGNISLPERFTLHEVGENYILGVRKDNTEVEQVVMYGLSGK